MNDEYRGMARAGLAPLVEDSPESPTWEQITSASILDARQPSRILPGWAIALISALSVVVLVGLALFTLEGSSVTETGGEVIFDVDQAVSEGEAWWSAVIRGDVDGALAIAHPHGQFNYEGLGETVSTLGNRCRSLSGEIYSDPISNQCSASTYKDPTPNSPGRWCSAKATNDGCSGR